MNPWAMIQFAHNQAAALVTGSFAITAIGAFYALRGIYLDQASLFLRSGTLVGLVASFLVAFPTGDQQAKIVAHHQPVTLAAMEGRFVGGNMADISVIGQPNVKERRLDNPIVIPGGLSFLANGTFESTVRGLNEFPQDTWPDNIELLYYAFHLMVMLGTIFIGLTAVATFQRLSRKAGDQPLAALAADAGLSVSLHCHHPGLDDRGIGAAAVACLRLVPHQPGLQPCGQQRQYHFYHHRIW